MENKTKQEVRQDYKNRNPEMGILSFYCIQTNESFLGISKDIEVGFNSSKFQLSNSMHTNEKLQKLYDLYGEPGFEYRVISKLDVVDLTKCYDQDLKELLDVCLMEIPNSMKLNFNGKA